ncbi:MAG: tetratricopeptide repeat protein [Planctomycetia bacterium]|nr:tetratricopeptide repeat protein [Planctomycetia bacterium]
MPADPRERRTVTVLFSDLSGFTRLSERMDPEEVQDLVDALFQRFRAAIESRGGTVDKFIGDAVMAVFGAPVAHEDDAVRAVRAGLAMQEEIAAFDAERGLGLRLRVGINTGEVLWGSVAGEKATVMGDAVNVAQRLESAAEPGTVLVSRAVERGLRGRFRLVGREAIHVKGRDEAIEVLQAVEELAGQTEHRPDGPAAAFVGRDDELARLLARVERGGGVVLLEGEAGIGKSRLAAELRRAFRERHRGAWVATGRALEGLRLPLAAFGDVVRQEAGVAGLDVRGGPRVVEALAAGFPPEDAPQALMRAHLVAASIGFSVPGSPVGDLDPARIAAETHFSWERWLSRRPGLLCLEDLHWADPATGALLAHLAAAPIRVAIVATARPGHSIPRAVSRWPLRDLDAAAAGRLAAALLRSPVAEDLARFLAEQSGGNPLYVEELARFLRDEKLLEGAPLRLSSAPRRVPEGLNGLLVARLDALAEGHKAVVKAASVLGRVFWSNLLAELSEADAGPAVAESKRRGLVFAQGPSLLPGDDQYLFRHALIRDAAYGLLTKKERQRLHARAADLLESRAAATGRRVRSLAAVQREAAGGAAAAADLWLASSREALADSAAEEALAAAREAERLGKGSPARAAAAEAAVALARLDEARADAEAVLSDTAADPPDADRARFVLLRVLERRGDFPAMLAAAEELANRALPPHRHVEALFSRASAHWRLHHFDEAVHGIAAGLAELEAVPALAATSDGMRVAAALRNLRGNVLRERSEVEPAMAEYRAALGLARSAGATRFAAGVLSNIGGVLAMTEGADAALGCYREAVDLLRPTGDRHGLALALTNVGIGLRTKGDWAGARAVLEESLALTRGMGDRWGQAGGLHNLGYVLRSEGDLEGARRHFEEALALRLEVADRQGACTSRIGLGIVAFETGRWEEAAEAFTEAGREGRAAENRLSVGLALSNLGSARLAAGDLAGAAEAWRETEEASRGLKQVGHLADVQDGKALLAALRGDAEEAARLAAHAADSRRSRGEPVGMCVSMAIAARLAAEAGRATEAGALAEEAVETARRAGLAGEEAYGRAARSAVRLAVGDVAGAVEDARAAAAGARADRLDVCTALALAELAAGRIEAATAATNAGRRGLETRRAPIYTLLPFLDAESRVASAAGDTARAAKAATQGLAVARSAGAGRWVKSFAAPQNTDG